MSTLDCKPGERPTRTGRTQPQADYRITLDGRDLSRLIAPNLVSLSLAESRADEADMLDLVIDDTQNTFAIPLRGASIAVSIGWVGEPLVDKGTYTVDEVEHSGAPDIITIKARSASMTNRMHERREKSWHRQTLGAIVRTIAARHGLTPAVDATLAKVVIDHIDQTQESDMSFLTRLAKRYDAVMTVKDKHLLFMPIGAGKTASGKTLDVLAITRASGDQHHYKIAQRDSYTAVRAHYHSNGKAQRKSVLVGDEKGKNTKVLPQDYATEAEARAAAQAEYARVQRQQATLGYTLALGRPELFPEMPVTVSGFKPEIDDTPWLVKKATHRIGNGGFTTELELEVRKDSKKEKKPGHSTSGKH
ncbi:late control protein [Burkholderia ubonensis]|uniref:phage late control D family protein n=1 Tax=Burkholderia ubonensis TaxID=101571 RepID=UPI00075F9F6A|nr:phage late control D family protein [Burkholderia ubonensis]AOK57809.1 late control protein [Burkholderia ubonensis]KWO23877.1 late control protein [Burkholderia ubonensis]MDY7792776.1 phage late control D family protein [Burkholderia ubonensis]ODQ35810.1 late control protein [Burkholderia ubonensis]